MVLGSIKQGKLIASGGTTIFFYLSPEGSF